MIKWNVNDRLEATYVASYTKRDLLVSRDASANWSAVWGYFLLAAVRVHLRLDLHRLLNFMNLHLKMVKPAIQSA